MCHHHVPGCSLELSAGRQTKIELLKTPAAAAATEIARATAGGGGHDPCCTVPRPLPPSDPRLVPRRCTALSALAPREAWSNGKMGAGSRGCPEGGFGRAGGGIGGGFSAGAVEVDFVGCVFGVTRLERPPSSSSPSGSPHEEEVFATASSILHEEDPPAAAAAASSASTSASASAASSAPFDEYVTYRVYLTDQSGACVVLTKRVRPELARHHRILRSAPGGCWAVVNAGKGGNSNGDAAELHVRRAEPAPAVTWSSTTAVGGSGSSPPPRSIGGAPAGHLARPLTALRRWAEDGEGQDAVRRERQRLALLLARNRRCGGTAARARASSWSTPVATAAARGGAAAARGEGVPSSPPLHEAGAGDLGVPGGDGSTAALVSAATAPRIGAGETGAKATQRGMPVSVAGEAGEPALVPRRPVTGSALGFVSSLEPFRCASSGQRSVDGGKRPVDSGDDQQPLLWLRVDTGEHLLAFALSKDSLGRLLRAALGHGDVPPSPVCGRLAAEGAQGGQEEEEEGGGSDNSRGEKVPTIAPRPGGGDTVRQLLALALSVLRCDDAVRREEGSSAVDARHEQRQTEAGAAASDPAGAGRLGGREQRPPPPSPPALSCARETAVEALAAAVCRVARRERDRCHRPTDPCGDDDAGASSSAVGRTSSLGTGPRGGGAISVADAATTGGAEIVGGPMKMVRPRPPVDSGSCSATARNGDAAAGRVAVGADGACHHEAEVCRSPTTTAPFDGGIDGTGGGVTAGSMLRDLAVACGGKQLSFSLSLAFSRVLGHEVETVEDVESVDVSRAAGRLLEDLCDSRVPPS